ncbi:cytochrome c(L), periplasmic [Methylococcus sp. EFPC2]|uniref:cytochrome c(L), periplasmic n=1 Tax=Methylococcus sp. EFPC2 TaxID=2812648 RepID=UPI0019687355|nr:cytochrome c(L), periplasmic [Methylococcus sp. EFPC2]QSA97372.1 cytochrome c(L), periplasmic [Methylococcus sp. EFPC2]
MKRRTLTALALGAALAATAASAEITFRHAITGETLDFEYGKKGGDTEAFKKFKQSGKNPYNTDKAAIDKGHSLYLTACSGCHGHEAEGKLGPGLADDYWTYPRGATDVGLFEILWGGAQGMMGPQYTNLNADELLQIMSFLRSIYKGDPAKAEWLK